MFSQFWSKLVAAFLALIFCVAVIEAWRSDRRDRALLAAELASTKQLLAAAAARQHDRDGLLAQTLAALDAQKRAVLTPAQIIRELPKAIPLPVPVTLQADHASSEGAALGPPAPNANDVAAGEASLAPTNGASAAIAPKGAFIPTTDLKPLYDFTLDCQACQARLSAAQGDLADERQKTAALTKGRDEAARIAKGGSAWRRVAKWFFLGAAAGAIAVKAAR